MRRSALLAILLLGACSAGESWREDDVALRPAEQLDLARYMGRWFEIARVPNRFEENCVGTTHDYAPRPDGRIDVVVTCRVATLAGPVSTYEGRARVLDPPSEWKVSFNPWVPWFFDGDYVILAVDPTYETAVVGDPSGQVGWILGRDFTMAEEDLQDAYDVLYRNGYDVSEIVLVDQPAVGN